MLLSVPAVYPVTMRRHRARNWVDGYAVAEVPVRVDEADLDAVPAVMRLGHGQDPDAITWHVWRGGLVTAYRPGMSRDDSYADQGHDGGPPPVGQIATETALMGDALREARSWGIPVSSPVGLRVELA